MGYLKRQWKEVVVMAGVLVAMAVAGAPVWRMAKGMVAGPVEVWVELPAGCGIPDVDPVAEGDGLVVFRTDYGPQDVRIACGARTYRVELNATKEEIYGEWKLGAARIE
ncbi:MAG: hypothetical protein ACO1SV_00915 [Fimbriimonas sp.]